MGREQGTNETDFLPDSASGIDALLHDLQYKLEDVADFIDELKVSGLINADSCLLGQVEQTTLEMRSMLKFARSFGKSERTDPGGFDLTNLGDLVSLLGESLLFGPGSSSMELSVCFEPGLEQFRLDDASELNAALFELMSTLINHSVEESEPINISFDFGVGDDDDIILTVAYMLPEQKVKEPAVLDEKSDRRKTVNDAESMYLQLLPEVCSHALRLGGRLSVASSSPHEFVFVVSLPQFALGTFVSDIGRSGPRRPPIM